MPQRLQREALERDLERAREKYTKTKEKISDLKTQAQRQKERVNRLETALDVFDQYAESGAMIGEDSSHEFLADEDFSISEAAKAVLRRAGRPMRNAEIADALLEYGFKYDKSRDKLRRSVSGVLSRESDFVRVDRGVYGLDSMENVTSNDDTNEKPPQPTNG